MASFVEDGAFNLEVDGHEWRVGAGDVMLSRPGMRFRAGFDGAGFSDTCLTLSYLAAGDDTFDAAQSWAKTNRCVLKATNRLRYLRWGLNRAVETAAPMFAEYCATEIFREVPGDGSAQPISQKKFNWYAERIDFARQRLAAALDEELTASDIAKSVGMSMFHFTRIFTNLVGMPPHRFRLRARLAEARRMINAGRSVTETCYACGFNNLSHFTRSFSRQHGLPPSKIAS
jgi:AraC-like DNA-binding protein